MQYDFIAIPDSEIPQAVEPVFQHVVTTYASEANKTVSMWRSVPDDLPSGSYAFHLTTAKGEDRIPFYVLPKRVGPFARIAFLASTFTFEPLRPAVSVTV